MAFRHIRLIFLSLFLVIASTVNAQENPTLLQINSDTTAMETGQSYTLRIEVHNVSELWASNVLIQYDPQHIYIVGTKSGSPVKIGDMMREGGDTIFNSVNVEQAQVNYAVSMFNPAEPVSGTGIIGTFEIVPLLAGTTQITFSRAEVVSVDFTFDENGQRAGGNPVDIEFLPVLLELTITGDPATPPPEATATPQPTSTIDPALLPSGLTEEVEPELINVTAVPTPLATTEVPTQDTSPLLLFAIVMVVLSSFGLIGLFFYVRRR